MKPDPLRTRILIAITLISLLPLAAAAPTVLATGEGTLLRPGTNPASAVAAALVEYALLETGQFRFSIQAGPSTSFYYFDEDISPGGTFSRESGTCGYRQDFTITPFEESGPVGLAITTKTCSDPVPSARIGEFEITRHD